MSAPRYAAIDPAVLMTVAGDRATFNTLSQTFLAHAPPLYVSLQKALTGGEHAAIVQHSHALKGMTVLVGAVELTALLQQIETAARQSRVAVPAAMLAPRFAAVQSEVALSMQDQAYGGES